MGRNLARKQDEIQSRGGIKVRLLICDTCRAVWPTEREPQHGGSRSDGEPCAYATNGQVCDGTVHPCDDYGNRIGGRRRQANFDNWWEPETEHRAYSGAWCETLKVPPGTTDLGLVRTRYRELSKTEHPDCGGTHERMLRLNLAYRQALAELGQP